MTEVVQDEGVRPTVVVRPESTMQVLYDGVSEASIKLKLKHLAESEGLKVKPNVLSMVFGYVTLRSPD